MPLPGKRCNTFAEGDVLLVGRVMGDTFINSEEETSWLAEGCDVLGRVTSGEFSEYIEAYCEVEVLSLAV